MRASYDGHQPDKRGYCERDCGRWPCDYAEKCDELETERQHHQRLRSAAEKLWDAAQPLMGENYEVVYFAVRGEAMDGLIELLYEESRPNAPSHANSGVV